MAADAIVEGWRRATRRRAQLGKWGAGFNEGVDRMRRLVCEYYDGFSFGNFVRKYPDLRGTVTDLLIGDLFTRSRRQGVGADGVAVSAGEEGDSDVEGGHHAGRGAAQGERAGAAGWNPTVRC